MCFSDHIFDPVDIQIDRPHLTRVNKSHRTNENTYERTNKRKTYERTNEWINEKTLMNERKNKCTHVHTYERMNGKIQLVGQKTSISFLLQMHFPMLLPNHCVYRLPEFAPDQGYSQRDGHKHVRSHSCTMYLLDSRYIAKELLLNLKLIHER